MPESAPQPVDRTDRADVPTLVVGDSLISDSMAADDLMVGRDESQTLSAILRCNVLSDLSGHVPDADFLKRFGIAYARSHRMIGIKRDDQSYVAICDRDGYDHLDIVGRALGRSITPIVATPMAIASAINVAYADRSSQAQQVIDAIDRDSVLREVSTLDAREDLLDTEGRAPIIRLVNHLLFDAVKAGASDVHIQPYEDRVIVRQRIDGVLFDSFEIPKAVQEEVLTRIKVLGRMNIAEKRLAARRPRDGAAWRSNGRPTDRVAADQSQRTDCDSIAR